MGKRRNKKKHNKNNANTSVNVMNNTSEEIKETSENEVIVASEENKNIVENSENTNIDVTVDNSETEEKHIDEEEKSTESSDDTSELKNDSEDGSIEEHIEKKEETSEEKEETSEKKEETSDELSEKQIEDLDNIRNKINEDVDKAGTTAQNIRNLYSYIEKARDLCKQNMSLVACATIIFISFIYVLVIGNIKEEDNLPSKELLTSSETILSVSMNNTTNKLDFALNKLCIETNYNDNKTRESVTQYITLNNFNWLRNSLNTDIEEYNIDGVDFIIDKNTSLEEFIITEQYGYIKYNNSENNGAKELIFSNIKPLNIDTTNIQKLSSRTYEYVTPINIQSYLNSYNDSFLMAREVIGGGKLNINTLIPQLKIIENSAIISDNSNGIVVELNELGNYTIKNDTEDKNIGLVYKDGILVIRDILNEKDLLYITSIDNQIIGCYKESLIKTTSDGIFITNEFNDELSNLYRTIAFATDNNLYVIKFVDEETEKAFCEQLGISLNNLKIDNVQQVVIEDN